MLMNCGLSTPVWRWRAVSIKVICIWSPHHPPLQTEQFLWCAGMNTSKCMWLNIVSYYCLLGDASEVNSESLSVWIALSCTSEGELEIRCFWFSAFSWKVVWEIYFKQLLLSAWSKALEFEQCVILSRAIIKPDSTQTFHNMCSVKHVGFSEFLSRVDMCIWTVVFSCCSVVYSFPLTSQLTWIGIYWSSQ